MDSLPTDRAGLEDVLLRMLAREADHRVRALLAEPPQVRFNLLLDLGISRDAINAAIAAHAAEGVKYSIAGDRAEETHILHQLARAPTPETPAPSREVPKPVTTMRSPYRATPSTNFGVPRPPLAVTQPTVSSIQAAQRKQAVVKTLKGVAFGSVLAAASGVAATLYVPGNSPSGETSQFIPSESPTTGVAYDSEKKVFVARTSMGLSFGMYATSKHSVCKDYLFDYGFSREAAYKGRLSKLQPQAEACADSIARTAATIAESDTPTFTVFNMSAALLRTLQSLPPQQELALQALRLGFPLALLLLDPYMCSLITMVKTTEPLW